MSTTDHDPPALNKPASNQPQPGQSEPGQSEPGQLEPGQLEPGQPADIDSVADPVAIHQSTINQDSINQDSENADEDSIMAGDLVPGDLDVDPPPADRPESELPGPIGNPDLAVDDDELGDLLTFGGASFPIIGVGASAGGLESLEKLFGAIQDGSNAAFVVVQHLAPDFESMMDEILRRRTGLHVEPIDDGTLVRPQHLYVLPPGYDVTIDNDILQLQARQHNSGVNQPIDRFFQSLAKSRGPACAVVICSGSGSDGSRGVREICECGGAVLIEDPDEAIFDGMPRAAMATGVADVVAPMSTLADWLQRYIDSYAGGENQSEEATQNRLGLIKILQILRNEYSIDFDRYKPNMIVRRIGRRLQLTNTESLESYIDRLEKDNDELNCLYHDLMIGVTKFYRDEEAFESLTRNVLPELVRNAPDSTLRVWTPGCATGEEAYTLAFELSKAIERSGRDLQVKIFATDAHRGSLEKASSGTFTADQLKRVPPDRLSRYFDLRGDYFVVNAAIRRMIVFAPHNLLSDASFTNVDLVVCRNTLIYFKPEAQRRALALMHFGLRENGYLFLGPSETPGYLREDYQTVDRRWRIYRKLRHSPSSVSKLTFTTPPRTPSTVSNRPAPATGNSIDRLLAATFEALATDLLPPTFITDLDTSLVYSTAGAGDYIRRQEGRFGGTLPELLIDALRTSVLVGLQRCERATEDEPMVVGTVTVPGEQIGGMRSNPQRDSREPDRRAGVQSGNRLIDGSTPRSSHRSTDGVDAEVRPSAATGENSVPAGSTSDGLVTGRASDSAGGNDAIDRNVRITIRRLIVPPESGGYCVTLEDMSIVNRSVSTESDSDDTVSRAEIETAARRTLEDELRYTRDNLHTTIQDLETSNEELQAINEEMVASNEELQSTNEELHSVNEELYTVNAEHQRKIEELTLLTEDMENLFRSSDIATIFLDGEGHIRRSTPKANAIFGLNAHDQGRLLSNFRNPFVEEDFFEIVDEALETGKAVRKRVGTRQSDDYLLKMDPYRSARETSGLVMTLVSLSEPLGLPKEDTQSSSTPADST